MSNNLKWFIGKIPNTFKFSDDAKTKLKNMDYELIPPAAPLSPEAYYVRKSKNSDGPLTKSEIESILNCPPVLGLEN